MWSRRSESSRAAPSNTARTGSPTSHVPIGKASFSEEALLTNLRALTTELQRAKPAAAKGKYVRKIVVSTTMGPGVQIDPSLVGSDA